MAGISILLFTQGKAEAAMAGVGTTVAIVTATSSRKGDDEDEFYTIRKKNLEILEAEVLQQKYNLFAVLKESDEEKFSLERKIIYLEAKLHSQNRIHQLELELEDIKAEKENQRLQLEITSIKEGQSNYLIKPSSNNMEIENTEEFPQKSSKINPQEQP